MKDSNIEKIAAIASTFLGATIEVQSENTSGRSIRYVEKADCDGFVIHWLGGEQSVIVFYVTNHRRELHYTHNNKIEKLERDGDEDQECFEFPVCGIQGVWNVGTTTKMRIHAVDGFIDAYFDGTVQVLLTKD